MLTGRIARAAAAAALAITSIAAVQLANPGAASARCVGHDAPTTTDVRNEAGIRMAWETPLDGTCNSNGLYQANLLALAGWTPELYTQNGGTWILRQRGAALYAQQSDTHQTREFLCAYHNSTGARYCGTSSGTDETLAANFCVRYADSPRFTCSHGASEYTVDAGYRLALTATDPDFGLLNSGF